MTDEAQLVGWIKCDCCGTRVLELVVSSKYPQGAVRIIAKHRSDKHETVIAIPELSSQIGTLTVRG